MTFTQKKKTNILHCDGCKKRCKLGVAIAEDDLYFPKIGGSTISSFQDENDNTHTTVRSKTWLSNKGIDHPFDQKNYMLDMARKIAKLCDNYKQR